MRLLDPDTLFMLLTCADSYVITKTLGVLYNVLANVEVRIESILKIAESSVFIFSKLFD